MPFEYLIIAFVIYSILKGIFGNDKKKREQLKQQQQRESSFDYEEDVVTQDAPTDWETAMKELESIFSGEPEPEKPKPVKEPIATVKTQEPPEQKPKEPGYETEMDRQRRLASFTPGDTDLIDELLSDETNPIFGAASLTASEGLPELKPASHLENLKSAKSLANAYITKEILDRPKALRKNRDIF